MPKVSIIVPVYNAEHRVGWCINSILKQNFRDFELILVNDGSTDASLRILRNYEKLDKRIKVVDIPNGGVSNARNTGLSVAKGEYIQFVDSDDVVNPAYTETLLKTLELYNADIVICGIRVAIVTPNTQVRTGNFNCAFFGKECVLEGKRLFENLPRLIWQSCTVEPPYNRIFRRNILSQPSQLQFKKGMNYGEDFLFNMGYLQRCNRAVFLQEPLYYYMIWPGESLARKYIPHLYQNQKLQLDKLREVLEEQNAITEENEHYLANYELGQIIKSFLSLEHEKCKLTTEEKKQEIFSILQDELVHNAFEKYTYIEPDYENLVNMVKHCDVGGILEEVATIKRNEGIRVTEAVTPPPAPGALNRAMVKGCRLLQKIFKKGFVNKWARITELNLMTVGVKTTLSRMKNKILRRKNL